MLQTTICYLEALNSKIPELVHQEQTTEGICGEVDQSERIICSGDPGLQGSSKEVSINEIIDPVHLVGLETASTTILQPLCACWMSQHVTTYDFSFLFTFYLSRVLLQSVI